MIVSRKCHERVAMQSATTLFIMIQPLPIVTIAYVRRMEVLRYKELLSTGPFLFLIQQLPTNNQSRKAGSSLLSVTLAGLRPRRNKLNQLTQHTWGETNKLSTSYSK